MKVAASNWQANAVSRQASPTAGSPMSGKNSKTRTGAASDPRDIDTDILETSAASLLKTGRDSKSLSASGSAAREADSDAPFKVKSSGPENSVGQLASMLASAETVMDVQLVLSKAMRALAELKMAAISCDGKEAKKYAQQIKRMEKLIKRIQKKIKHLSKEQSMEERAKKAAKKAQLEKEKQIRQELKARRRKRRREEREYALKEQATDGKIAMNETISSVLNAASPTADLSSMTGLAGDLMAGDFSGMDMGGLDIMA